MSKTSFNFSKRQQDGNTPIGFNTYIGGVGGNTINSANNLSAKLSIPITNILNFEIIGNNVRCFINSNYSVGDSCWIDDLFITSFYDVQGKCLSYGYNSFTRNPQCKRLWFPGLQSIGYNAFWEFNNCRLYFPSLINFGQSVLDNGCWQYNQPKGTIYFYTNPFLATNNSGNPDGDIQKLTNVWDGFVFYSSNNTPPNKITDLSFSNNSGTINLTWSAITAVNNLTHYDVHINGFWKQGRGLTNNAAYSDLNNGDKISVFAYDEKGNRTESNEIIITGL